MNIVPLEQLSFADFAGLAGTNVRVWLDANDSLELQMCEITPVQSGTLGGLPYEQFTLIFLGPGNRLLPQRIYAFEAASIGRFELFIVPVSRDPDGLRYEATFNRLVKAG